MGRQELEAYASTFWSALNGLLPANIKRAQGVDDFACTNEMAVDENVLARDEEYLARMD